MPENPTQDIARRNIGSIDPTAVLGGFMSGFGSLGTGSIPPINQTALSGSDATTRIGFATGSFGGSGLNAKNILIYGAIALLGIFVYKKFM